MTSKNKFKVYTKSGQEYHFRAALKAFDPSCSVSVEADYLIVDTYLKESDIKFTSVIRIEHYLNINMTNCFVSAQQTLTLKEIQDRIVKAKMQSPIAYVYTHALYSKDTQTNETREIKSFNLQSFFNIQTNFKHYTDDSPIYLRHENRRYELLADSSDENIYPILDVILDDACEIVFIYNENMRMNRT